MGAYKIQHNYRSNRGGFTAGDVVDLSDDDAAWYEVDSPGLLQPTEETASEPTEETTEETAGEPAEAEPEPTADPDQPIVEESKPPARRGRKPK